MWSYIFLLSVRKMYISMLSLYSIWDYYFFLFLYWKKLCCPFLHSTQLFLYTICLEDISKGIWIVRIGMYFLGFYKVSLNNYITISIAMKSRNKRHRFWKYSLQAQKNLLQIWTFICTPLNISAFAFMQMSMYLHS